MKKLSTKNNLFAHVELLKIENVNDIASQDWTGDELEAFVEFLHYMATAYNENRALEIYKDFVYKLNSYYNMVAMATLEELEDKEDTPWIDEAFHAAALAAEDMAAELVLYGNREYFKNIYA